MRLFILLFSFSQASFWEEEDSSWIEEETTSPYDTDRIITTAGPRNNVNENNYENGPNLVIDYSTDYHHTSFYEQKYRQAGLHNGRAKYVAYTYLKNDPALAVEIRWDMVYGQYAWTVVGVVTRVGHIIIPEALRFVSWSDVSHPHLATDWSYFPFKGDTPQDRMVPSPKFKVTEGTMNLDSGIANICDDYVDFYSLYKFYSSDNSDISCPTGEVIQIIDATYTRRSPAVCNDAASDYNPSDEPLCPQELDLTKGVYIACNGKNACSYDAQDQNGTKNMCRRVDKYTIVRYRCEKEIQECNVDHATWTNNWINDEVMSCEDYFTNGWCTAEGANGEQFSKLSYYYDFQEASLGKRIGEFTALNCPQCGCVTGYVADTTIEYVEDKEFDFAVKVEEMAYKTSDEYCDCFVVNKPDGLTYDMPESFHPDFYGKYVKAEKLDRWGHVLYINENGQKYVNFDAERERWTFSRKKWGAQGEKLLSGSAHDNTCPLNAKDWRYFKTSKNGPLGQWETLPANNELISECTGVADGETYSDEAISEAINEAIEEGFSPIAEALKQSEESELLGDLETYASRNPYGSCGMLVAICLFAGCLACLVGDFLCMCFCSKGITHKALIHVGVRPVNLRYRPFQNDTEEPITEKPVYA